MLNICLNSFDMDLKSFLVIICNLVNCAQLEFTEHNVLRREGDNDYSNSAHKFCQIVFF